MSHAGRSPPETSPIPRPSRSSFEIGRFALAGVAATLWITAVAWPLVVGIGGPVLRLDSINDRAAAAGVWSWSDAAGLLLTTAAWGGAVGLAALVLAIPAALVLASPQSRVGFLLPAMFGLLCIPNYLVFWIWGFIWRRPDSALIAWASEAPHRVEWVTAFHLWCTLVIWAWPIPAFTLASALHRIPRERVDSWRLDGLGRTRRLLVLLRESWTGAAVGVGVVALTTVTSYVAFDLAPVDNYGNVLRRLRYEAGAEIAAVASIPMVVLAAASTWWLIRAWQYAAADEIAIDSIRSGRAASALAHLLSLGVLVAIVVIVLTNLRGLDSFRDLRAIEGQTLVRSLTLAAVSGLLFAALALHFATAWSSERRGSRRLATIMAIGWIVMGLLPGATIGAALSLAYNRAATAALYDSPIIITLGHLARFGLVAALVGRWIADSESRERRALRRLDGAETLMSRLRAGGGSLVAPVLAAGAIGLALSLGEISTTVIVTPAGTQTLSERLLNKMHYAREDSALATTVLLAGLTFGLGAAASLGLRGRRRRSTSTKGALTAFVGAMTLALVGCDRPPTDESSVFSPEMVFGSTGRLPGQFIYPRAITIDPIRERLYVVDKSGRVQLFNSNSGSLTATWALPEFDNGFPTGIHARTADGRVFVADTHENRITIFDEQGVVHSTIGGYGTENGEFIYPTSVAFGPNGRIYVAEYGGNDRIQAFDADGDFEFSFGVFGYEHGEFNRPQSIEFDSSRGELWIADACNHRLVVTDADGNWLKVIGSPGPGPGQLNYPYDLELLDDGSVLVAEFGANRIQRLSRDGECLGLYGVVGDAAGELKTPWGVAVDGDRAFILDSGNDRVQVVRLR
ncbi:MAG: hypothetical protein ACF8PN_13140 [Phycisphaerales bacterium]